MGNNVHDIIKAERKKRGIPTFYWSKEMARLAQSQANHCARVGRMVHSDRYAFQGGENLCGGKGNFSPRQTVNSWLGSPRHREYILSPRVTKAGVGIAKRNGKMFYAWAFSDASPSYPDCPSYKNRATPIRLPSFKLKGLKRRSTMKLISLAVTILSAFVLILGVHGLYVHFMPGNFWQHVSPPMESYSGHPFGALERALDILGGGNIERYGDLFGVYRLPWILEDITERVTFWSLESWFMPVVLTVGGFLLLRWRRGIANAIRGIL